MKFQSTELKAHWVWKEKSADTSCLSTELDDLNKESGWTPVHAMPSDIHVELMKSNRIPDPYLGFNEHKVQWVGEREWLYASIFAFDMNDRDEHTELVFEGLDTFCTVYMNEEIILEAENQFRTYRVALDAKKLKPKNKLLLYFKSAKTIAKELEHKYGRVRAGSVNLGDPSRVYVRKAQYDWRWDWGPELLTVGPYRPIRLLTYTSHLFDLHVRAIVSPTLTTSMAVTLTLRGDISAVNSVTVILRDADGRVVKQEEAIEVDFSAGHTKNVIQWQFREEEVKLWWPVGYGAQILYTVEVILIGENLIILDQKMKTIGFRRVQLIQEPLAEADRYGRGTTFLFEINNVRMFMGGSNWVPADSFLTTISPSRYRAWLQLLKDGNQNVVRLWGGGVYEPDLFYDICDTLGIMVWQDFQFACGVYPAHDEFVESVRAEAEDNVTRLRHHPSIVLFCGNNEDYQQVLQWGDVAELPARKIYEDLLPEIVSRLTYSDIPYHRGSPYGGKGWDTADPTVGDIHQWNIWAGEKNYQDYDIMGGRFVSEFGMPAMPDIRTIDHWLDGDEKQRHSQSKLMSQHNKAGSHERRFAVVMNENFRLTEDFETHAYHTQMLQSEAVGWAYRAWRREWRGNGKQFTGGVIVWQLNDCWPVTSWAIADYFLRPKPAYFSIARELRTYTVGISRIVEKNRATDRPRQFYEFGAFRSIGAHIEVWGTNSTPVSRNVKLELNCLDLESDWNHKESYDVKLEANQSTEILSTPCPEPPPASKDASGGSNTGDQVTRSHTVLVAVRLIDEGSGEILARYVDWPQPYRYLEFPDPGLHVTVDGEIVCVDVKHPVKGLVFSVVEEEGTSGGQEVRWSDNTLDVMPGDPQVIVAQGLGRRKLKVAYMGKGRSTACPSEVRK